jgi:ubiquitin-protein ligase
MDNFKTLITLFNENNYNIKIKLVNDELYFDKFKFKIDIEENQYVLNFDYDNYNHNYDKNLHLFNILKDKNLVMDHIDQFMDLLEKIINIILKLHHHCISCYNIIEYPDEDKLLKLCGKNECDNIFNTLTICNPVSEFMNNNNNKEIGEFLLLTGLIAITSNRRDIIFTPFPTKLYEDKDFKEIDNILNELNSKKFTFKTILNILQQSSNDKDIIKIFGKKFYLIIRFILGTNNTKLYKTEILDSVNIKVLSINHHPLIEEKFKERSNNIYKGIEPIYLSDNNIKTINSNSNSNLNSKSFFIFHGSSQENWYSILRNGLKNASNTKLMVNAAAYGNGIYLTDSITFAQGYSVTRSQVINNLTSSITNKYIIGVCEVVGPKNEYNKNGTIHVVGQEQDVLLRYLLWYDNSNRITHVKEQAINNVFNISMIEDRQIYKNNISSKSAKRLHREFGDVTKQEIKDLGFDVEIINDNITMWRVKISKFDEETTIFKEMIKYNISYIEYEVKFPDDYPFEPPFVRVVQPRFQYRTGHVTVGGSICIEILTSGHWPAVMKMEALLIQLKNLVIAGEGEFDPKLLNTPYELEEAKSAFYRTAKGHGWL